MIKFYICISLFIFFLISCAPEKSTPTESNSNGNVYSIETEAVNWIKDNANQISTVDIGDGYLDLMPLKSIIGNAKIVALGEATYGTHECQAVKLRLLEFLVKEMDFNIFAMETPYPETEEIDYYVQTGLGDVEDLFLQLIWWRQRIKHNNILRITQEAVDVITWIYNYNRNAPSASDVKFCGFGVQRPQKAMNNVVEYLFSIDSTAAQFIDSLYSEYHSYCWKYPEVSTNIMNNCRARVQIAFDTLNNQKDKYELMSSIEEYTRAHFFAEFVVRSEQVLRNNMDDLRKTYMMDLIDYIFNQSDPNSKMVIWNHNVNVGNFTNGFGHRLKVKYNQDIINFGFNIYQGYFFAHLLNPVDGSYSSPCLFELPASPKESYEEYLHSVDIPMYFLDINSNILPQGNPETEWLYGPKKTKEIELYYEPYNTDQYFKSIQLKDIYDIMIYLENVDKSELLFY